MGGEREAYWVYALVEGRRGEGGEENHSNEVSPKQLEVCHNMYSLPMYITRQFNKV